ncbi:MAG: RNA-binding protein [Gammaproteobacteria bacterium]|jgi:RNA recognition motif-containing protein
MSTIYVGNLPLDTKPDIVKALFSRYGRVSSLTLQHSGATLNSRSYCLIEMPEYDAASHAVQRLNGQFFGGLFLRVERLEKT